MKSNKGQIRTQRKIKRIQREQDELIAQWGKTYKPNHDDNKQADRLSDRFVDRMHTCKILKK